MKTKGLPQPMSRQRVPCCCDICAPILFSPIFFFFFKAELCSNVLLFCFPTFFFFFFFFFHLPLNSFLALPVRNEHTFTSRVRQANDSKSGWLGRRKRLEQLENDNLFPLIPPLLFLPFGRNILGMLPQSVITEELPYSL